MSTVSFNELHTSYAKAWTEYHISDEEIRMRHHEDTTEIEQVNKFLQTFSPQELTDKKSGWRWVARIPLSLDAELARKGIYKDKAAFNRWKNDPANRTWALCRDRKIKTTPAGVQVITKERREP